MGCRGGREIKARRVKRGITIESGRYGENLAEKGRNLVCWGRYDDDSNINVRNALQKPEHALDPLFPVKGHCGEWGGG